MKKLLKKHFGRLRRCIFGDLVCLRANRDDARAIVNSKRHYAKLHKKEKKLRKKLAKQQVYIDISTGKDKVPIAGTIAVHLHVYYVDLVDYMMHYLNSIPYKFDLFVSVTNEPDAEICKKKLANVRNVQKVTVAVVINRGRDISPMVCTFADDLMQYDYLCHLHTKKSISNSEYDKIYYWRDSLINSILKDEQQVYNIFQYLQRKDCGVIFPEPYHSLGGINLSTDWTARVPEYKQWESQYLKKSVTPGTLFPAGTMFWARVESLRDLLNAKIALEDFPEESGVLNDYSFAHVLERFMGYVPVDNGYVNYIIKNPVSKYFGGKMIREARRQVLLDSFDSASYVSLYPDVAAANVNPRSHFEKNGEQEGRYANYALPSSLLRHHLKERNIESGHTQLDEEFYLTTYMTAAMDFLFEDIHPNKHYAEVGKALGYIPDSHAIDEIRNKNIVKQLKFTVIVYVDDNDCDKLKKTIRSILAQTVNDIEVVIVNNDAIKNIQALISDLPDTGSIQFKIIDYVVRKEKPLAYNEGIESATGEYFVLLECGDYIQNVYLERMSEIAVAYDTSCVSCRKAEWHESQNGLPAYTDSIDIRLLKGESKVNALARMTGYPALKYELPHILFNTREWNRIAALTEEKESSVHVDKIALFHFINQCDVVTIIRNPWLFFQANTHTDKVDISEQHVKDIFNVLDKLFALLDNTYVQKTFFERCIDNLILHDFFHSVQNQQDDASFAALAQFTKCYALHENWFTNKQRTAINRFLDELCAK